MAFLSDKLQLISSFFLGQMLRICTGLIMARLISRDDFGLYLLIFVLPGFLNFGDLGIATSWIQMQDKSTVTRDTAVVFGVALYSFYALVWIASGSYIAIRYHDHRMWMIGIILSVTDLLQMLYGLQLAELNQRLHFRAEARQNLIFAFMQAAAGICMAAVGFGIFALAIQGLIAQLAATAVISRSIQLRWPRSFSAAIARRYIALGGKVAGATYVNNLQNSFISFGINRSAGVGPLGDWGRATQVQAIFGQNLMASFERVTFPVLCASTGDLNKLRDVFTKATLCVQVVAIFAAAWLCTLREEIVSLGLGSQWSHVPPVLAIIALALPACALASMCNRACYALGQTTVLLSSSTINTLIFIPVFFFVYPFGLEAIAWLWLASQVSGALLNFSYIVWLIRPSISRLLRQGGLLLLAGIATGTLMGWSRDYLLPGTGVFIRFMVCSVGGLLLYGLLVWVTQPQLLQFIWRISRHPPVRADKREELNRAPVRVGTSPGSTELVQK